MCACGAMPADQCPSSAFDSLVRDTIARLMLMDLLGDSGGASPVMVILELEPGALPHPFGEPFGDFTSRRRPDSGPFDRLLGIFGAMPHRGEAYATSHA